MLRPFALFPPIYWICVWETCWYCPTHTKNGLIPRDLTQDCSTWSAAHPAWLQYGHTHKKERSVAHSPFRTPFSFLVVVCQTQPQSTFFWVALRFTRCGFNSKRTSVFSVSFCCLLIFLYPTFRYISSPFRSAARWSDVCSPHLTSFYVI